MLYILIAVLIIVGDQLLKYWVVQTISLGGYMKLLPGVVGLTYVRNTGAAFSLFAEHTWILAVVSVLASLLLIYIIFFRKLPLWERVALSMVLGGAVGNLIDRVFLGYVVDMFNFEFMNFAIFNLADAFIDVGAAIFVILYAVRSAKEEKEAKKREN